MPEDGTGKPGGRPTATLAQHPPWWRRHKLATAVGGAGIVLAAAAGTGVALASGTSGGSRPIPAARSYANPTSVLAAMGKRGVVCADVGPAGEFMDCSGASDGDTVIGMFDNHAEAVAYADGMVTLGLTLHTPTAEVVGPNWVVNTSPAFADEVVDAIGGQVITKDNAQPLPTSAPAAAWPASVIRGAG